MRTGSVPVSAQVAAAVCLMMLIGAPACVAPPVAAAWDTRAARSSSLLAAILSPAPSQFALSDARSIPPLSMECHNGGTSSGEECVCPIYYTGDDCAQRQCPNSIGGDGPYRILPVNPTTMYCDDCDTADHKGLNCQLCQRDSACGVYGGPGASCNRDIAIRGDNKQYQCMLKNEYFVRLMGDGRNISADIMLNCSTDDGSAFARGDRGRCSMAIYRVEPNAEYVDPFFRCEASQCTMRHGIVDKNDDDDDGDDWEEASLARRVFQRIRQIGQITLVGICGLVALLGLIARALGHRRLSRVTAVLGGMLTFFSVVYIALMVASMMPLEPQAIVVYECKKTRCACAEDPPARYKPICSKSDILDKKILPAIRNTIRITCLAGTGNCELTLTDLSLVFNADCQASECVDADRFPIGPDGPDVDPNAPFWTRQRIMSLLFLGVLLSVAGVIVHWRFSVRRSTERAKEFLVLFNVSVGAEIDGDGDSTPDGAEGDGDGEGGAAGRREGRLPPCRVRSAAEAQEDLRLGESPEAAAPRGGGGGYGDDEDEEAAAHNERGRLIQSESHTSIDGIDGGAMVYDSRNNVRASVMRRASHLTREEQADVAGVRRLTRSVLELSVVNLRYALAGSCLSDQADYDDRVILNNINFSVRSGEVLAIMGTSGAGKTTLLDLLSARAKSGYTRGNILLNRTPIYTTGARSREYRNIIGYVSQEDTLLPALTVRQTIEYAARLKLPTAFSRRTIKRIVNRMIAVLKLTSCEHTVVGNNDGVRGISGGEKRRVSIAVELLANPRILFLDEPTSGLDAVSAKRVVEAVVELAKDSPMRHYAPHYFAFRPIVIFSIHQPSVEIYDLFDQILLLSRGVSVYCGRAHDAPAVLERRVTESFGHTRAIPRKDDHHNPAEYLMKLEEILDDNVRAELQEEDVRERTQRAELQQRQSNSAPLSSTRDSAGPSSVASRLEEITVSGDELLATTASFNIYYADIYQQLALLTSRAVTSLMGSFHLVACHALVVVCLASLMAFLYQEQALDLPGFMNRVGCFSFLLLVTSFVSLSCLEQLILERKLFNVERENGFYSTFPYLFSKLFVDVFPLRILPAVVLTSVIYFPMGFRVDSGIHFCWFILITVLFSVCMTLMVMCIGIVTGTFGAAALASSVFILWNFVFGGALVQTETIPWYLRVFSNVSPFFLAYESLMVNELNGQACVFSPTDETGAKSDVEIDIMCTQYLANAGLKPDRFGPDVMQLGVYCFVFAGLAWLLLATCTRLVR